MVWVRSIEINRDEIVDYGAIEAVLSPNLAAVPAYSTQTLAPTELRVLSQPPGEADIYRYKNYVYRANHPIGSFIYHVEFGINSTHPDFAGRQLEWIYTRRAQELHQDTPTEAVHSNGHSTCTASKAAGMLYGASKVATLVIVKMADRSEASMDKVFGTIYDDITLKRRQGKSVVSVSWGSDRPLSYQFPHIPPYERLPAHWQLMIDYIQKLYQISVLVVVAAGNNAASVGAQGRRREFVDSPPALLQLYLPNVVAVGNAYRDGARRWQSQLSDTVVSHNRLFAPGYQVSCADSATPKGYKTVSGTSFCTCPFLNLVIVVDDLLEFISCPFGGWRFCRPNRLRAYAPLICRV